MTSAVIESSHAVTGVPALSGRVFHSSKDLHVKRINHRDADGQGRSRDFHSTLSVSGNPQRAGSGEVLGHRKYPGRVGSEASLPASSGRVAVRSGVESSQPQQYVLTVERRDEPDIADRSNRTRPWESVLPVCRAGQVARPSLIIELSQPETSQSAVRMHVPAAICRTMK